MARIPNWHPADDELLLAAEAAHVADPANVAEPANAANAADVADARERSAARIGRLERREYRERPERPERRERADRADRAYRSYRADGTAVDRHLVHCASCRARLDVLETTLREAAEQYQRLIADDDASASATRSTTKSTTVPTTMPASRTMSRSMTAQRARLAEALIAMPASRLSVAVLPPWAVAAAAAVVAALIAPWATWLTHRPGDVRASSSLSRELPAVGLTPGAAARVAVSDLCAGRAPSRVVSADVRDRVLRAYGMQDVPIDAYELDALITPELGGTTDARNLWPQRYTSLVWHARVKDVLEERLAADVCAGRLDLAAAQRDLATDWVAAYRRYFRTDAPLQAHLEPRPEEPELEIAAPRPPRIVADTLGDYGLGMGTVLIIALPLST